MRSTVLVALLAAPVLLLTGCQACVVDSSQPEDPPPSHPAAMGSVITMRPRLMTPMAHLMVRDAGDGDE